METPGILNFFPKSTTSPIQYLQKHPFFNFNMIIKKVHVQNDMKKLNKISYKAKEM